MPSQFEISIVGDVEVRVGGCSVLSGKRKALALIAYLALHPAHSLPRGVIAGLLWEGSAEAPARNSLRQILSDIRKALPTDGDGVVRIGRETVSLRADAFSLDAAVMMEDLQEGRIPAELFGHGNPADTLFRGIEGIGDEFDVWLHEHRILFEDQLMSRLSSLMDSASIKQEQRLKAAQIVQSLDGLNEKACRMIMTISADRGETSEALRVYDALYQRLEDEMDIEPSPQTQDLAVRIKMGEYEAPVAAPLPAAARAVSTDIPHLAVFPFQSLGPDAVPEFFVDGILEDTVCMLATLKEPRVISSNSTRYVDLAHNDPLKISAELGAQYTVFGTVRSAFSKFHISVQLVEVGTGLVDWARTYTASVNEIFDIQAHIASSIANKLLPSMQLAELRRTAGYEPKDLNAYHLTLRAKELSFRLDEATFPKARDLLMLAAEKDPMFAPTYVALTDWYSVCIGQGWSHDAKADWQALDGAALKALRLSGGNGRAMAMYAHNQAIQTRDYDTVLPMLEQALDQSPNDAEALMWSVPALTFSDHVDLAIERGQRAISLSPNDPFLFRYQHFLSIALYAAGDLKAAARLGQESYEQNPQYTSNLRLTTAALMELGQVREAQHFAEQMKQLDTHFSVEKFMLNQPFNDADVSRRYMKQLQKAGL